MTREGKVTPAHTKLSATPAYTVAELRDKMQEYHKLVMTNAEKGLLYRLYLNGFLNWLENPEEFTGR